VRIETLAIGDELLTGKISDTNSAFVAAELFRRGMRLDRCQVVADEDSAIVSMLRDCGARADYVICFGGLGPTSDDRTAQCAADALGVQLVDDPTSMERLLAFAKKRNRSMTPQLLKQVKHPAGTGVLPNTVGLAPGFSCRIGTARFFFLPGVPAEMKPMFLASVLPELERELLILGGEKFLSRVWKCIGIPESELQRLMDPIEASLPKQAWLGYRTKFPENHLVLYWRSRGPDDAASFEAKVPEIRSLLGGLVYTEDDTELEEMVLRKLREKKLTLAFAESCTGGLCSQRVTKVAGASENFWGAEVVYQNAAKKTLLGIELETPEQAVSAKCSRELALALREKSGVDVALAITGYLGPTGGTAEDPIGTIYIAIASIAGLKETRISAPGTHRDIMQIGASTHALNQLRLVLQGE
jgi:nicotinamide-nucleotide amidase